MPDSVGLRRYLEQLRELGDSEIVFDSIRAGEVAGMLRASAAAGWRASLSEAGVEVEQSVTSSPNPGTSMKPKKGKVAVDESNPSTEAIAKLTSLKAAAEKVIGCTRCALFATATHGVPGEGKAKAQVVCVGEAPGATEDETGLPFVGAAGALLTKILASIDLTREEVFITNVVKHRPPANRNPTPEEVAACSPYLIRQLELIKPKVIIAFGNFAAQTLLSTKDGIGKLRGSVHTYHGTPLVVTYHPAALLRNPSWKRPTWEDVKLARRVLDKA